MLHFHIMSESFTPTNNNTPETSQINRLQRIFARLGGCALAAIMVFGGGAVYGKSQQKPSDIGTFDKNVTNYTTLAVCHGARFRSDPIVNPNGRNNVIYELKLPVQDGCITMKFPNGTIYEVSGFCTDDEEKPVCDKNGSWYGVRADALKKQITDIKTLSAWKTGPNDIFFVNGQRAKAGPEGTKKKGE